MQAEKITDDGTMTLTFTPADRRALERLLDETVGLPDLPRAASQVGVTLWRYVRMGD